MSLFSTVARRTGEDLITEVIGYLLNNEDVGEPFRTSFLSLVVPDLLPDVKVDTQFAITGESRPDIRLMGGKGITVIEAKFGAGFQDLQLLRYAEHLKGLTRSANSGVIEEASYQLILLAPAHRKKELLDKADIDSVSENGSKFKDYCAESSIRLKYVTWEDVTLKCFPERHQIQDELRDYIMDHLPIPLTKDARVALSDMANPNSLRALMATIQSFRSLEVGQDEHTVLSSFGSSYNWAGYKLTRPKHNYSLWFGMILEPWSENGHPLYIQLRSEWVESSLFEMNKHRLPRKLKKDNKYNYQYLRIVRLDEIENLESIFSDMYEELDELFGPKQSK